MIQKFTDLVAWKEARQLVLFVYKETLTFPKSELFGMTDQMRRAAVSVSSNIAEGFSRQGKKEKLQFYFMAKGSLTELENQLIISKDLEYVECQKFEEISVKIEVVGRLLTGLIKSIRSRS